MRSLSASVLALAVCEVSASGRKLNAGQRLGVHRSEHKPDFPYYPAMSDYTSSLIEQATALEDQMVNDVSEAHLMSTLKEITTLGDGSLTGRSYSNPEATDVTVRFLQDQFHQMGFEENSICLQNFTMGKYKLTNVIAAVDVPGASGSVTVGAHYDSRPFTDKAPGANDNGSGLSALLEIAKVFRGDLGAQQLRKPVYFVAFAGEEAGLWGSKQFATALKDRTDKSLPDSCRSAPAKNTFLRKSSDAERDRHEALIMDEVGWRSPSLEEETVNLESFDSDEIKPLLDHLAHSNDDHNGKNKLKLIHSNHPFGSDHMSWSDLGFPSVLSINGDDEAYPNYHKSSDDISVVSSDMLDKVTKMNLGALMRLVGLDSSMQEEMVQTSMQEVQKHD